MNTRTKLLLLGGVFVVLLIFGAIFARVRLPHIVVAPESVGLAIGPLVLTNTIVAAWFAIAVVLLFVWAATRNMQMVPTGLQNLLEAVVEAFLRVVESVVGARNARRLFPLVFTIFLFVMISNWMGLLPGFGTIGPILGHQAHDEVWQTQPIAGAPVSIVPFGPPADDHGGHCDPSALHAGEVCGTFHPFLRGATTDLNMTLAIALIAVIYVQYIGFSTLGLGGYGSKFINLGELRKGNILTGVIFFFVGLLEIIGEISRVISFTFRLFGNIFAGEVLLVVMAFLLPWVATVPFLGLELFVGFIQAFVFAMLTVVFAASAMISHGDHGDEHHGHAAEAPAAHH